MPMAARLQLQRELTVFEDILGGCERLLRTPIPVSYTRHSTRMIVGWLTLFPVWLQNQAGLELIPTTALIAFLLLGAPSPPWARAAADFDGDDRRPCGSGSCAVTSTHDALRDPHAEPLRRVRHAHATCVRQPDSPYLPARHE